MTLTLHGVLLETFFIGFHLAERLRHICIGTL